MHLVARRQSSRVAERSETFPRASFSMVHWSDSTFSSGDLRHGAETHGGVDRHDRSAGKRRHAMGDVQCRIGQRRSRDRRRPSPQPARRQPDRHRLVRPPHGEAMAHARIGVSPPAPHLGDGRLRANRRRSRLSRAVRCRLVDRHREIDQAGRRTAARRPCHEPKTFPRRLLHGALERRRLLLLGDLRHGAPRARRFRRPLPQGGGVRQCCPQIGNFTKFSFM